MSNDFLTRGPIAPLFLRLALGAILLYHGIVKVLPPNDWGTAWATNTWAAMAKAPPDVLDKIGEVKGVSSAQLRSVQVQVEAKYNTDAPPMPEAITAAAAQMAVAWGELLGGVALLLGALTRLAAVGVIVIQLGAIFTVTFERGFSFAAGGGYEFNVALVAMCLSLVVLGAGPLSVDGYLAERRTAGKKTAAAPSEPAVAAPS
jgi:uncharacterized membrane protein YphA (DoxX/SURF4 family)